MQIKIESMQAEVDFTENQLTAMKSEYRRSSLYSSLFCDPSLIVPVCSSERWMYSV